MTCAVRVKMELRYEPGHGSVRRAEEHLATMLNHPDARVLDVRIAPGHSAGAVFLVLTDDSRHRIERLETSVQIWLDGYYAEDVRVLYSQVEAVCVERDGEMFEVAREDEHGLHLVSPEREVFVPHE